MQTNIQMEQTKHALKNKTNKQITSMIFLMH
jgi:hypothetical protein